MALQKFGALWKGKPTSKAVLTGKLDDGRKILVFKNEDKKSDKHPDYRLVVDDGLDAGPKPGHREPISDDDTPF
jgi:hypothetical protein